MAYTKKTWEDYPDTSTPITADNLQNIEDGIEALDLRLNNDEIYVTATAGSNGDFYVTLADTTLTTNRVIRINFPAATNGASNARLSVDGSGGTYRNLKNIGEYQLLGSDVQNKKLTCYYNGTDIIVINITDMGKYIKIGKSNLQSIPATTTVKVTWDTTTENNTKGLSFDNTNDRIVVGKGINSLLIMGQYQENTLTTGIQKYIYIWKNGVSVKSYRIGNQSVVDIIFVASVTENDYIEMYCYGSSALDIQPSSSWTFLQAVVLS